jgi:FtsH-binding integral membrane protein
MYCPNCKEEFDDDYYNCPNCGTPDYFISKNKTRTDMFKYPIVNVILLTLYVFIYYFSFNPFTNNIIIKNNSIILAIIHITIIITTILDYKKNAKNTGIRMLLIIILFLVLNPILGLIIYYYTRKYLKSDKIFT